MGETAEGCGGAERSEGEGKVGMLEEKRKT